MYYYALSLQVASFLMVNSSWTKNHVDGILNHSDALLDAVHTLSPLILVRVLLPFHLSDDESPNCLSPLRHARNGPVPIAGVVSEFSLALPNSGSFV